MVLECGAIEKNNGNENVEQAQLVTSSPRVKSGGSGVGGDSVPSELRMYMMQRCTASPPTRMGLLFSFPKRE